MSPLPPATPKLSRKDKQCFFEKLCDSSFSIFAHFTPSITFDVQKKTGGVKWKFFKQSSREKQFTAGVLSGIFLSHFLVWLNNSSNTSRKQRNHFLFPCRTKKMLIAHSFLRANANKPFKQTAKIVIAPSRAPRL